jgi:hypothetical protein
MTAAYQGHLASVCLLVERGIDLEVGQHTRAQETGSKTRTEGRETRIERGA